MHLYSSPTHGNTPQLAKSKISIQQIWATKQQHDIMQVQQATTEAAKSQQKHLSPRSRAKQHAEAAQPKQFACTKHIAMQEQRATASSPDTTSSSFQNVATNLLDLHEQNDTANLLHFERWVFHRACLRRPLKVGREEVQQPFLILVD